mgnify:CR=1 FL=1
MLFRSQGEGDDATLHRPRVGPSQIADAVEEPLIESELGEGNGLRLEDLGHVGDVLRLGPYGRLRLLRFTAGRRSSSSSRTA